MKLLSLSASAAVVVSALSLVACGGDEREAESSTPVAEAEVTTTQPESAISDQALQNTADQAAVAASTPEAGAMSTGTTTIPGSMSESTTTTTTATPQ